MGRRQAILPVMLVALSTVLALAMLVRGPYAHADDAYIVARYAEHLVQHGQLTWNLGEAPVEGFTGYTLLFVMTIATALHVPPVTTAAALGVAAWFVGARILYACHKPLGVSRWAGAFATALFLCAAEQVTHAMSGLETEIFILGTLACVFVAAQRSHEEPGKGLRWQLPTLASFCAFTRPEGVIVGGGLLLAVLFRERAAWRAWVVPTALGFLLPYGLLQVFRRIYFGSFLPNTYYAKLAYGSKRSVFFSSFSTHAQKYLVPSLVVCAAIWMIHRFAEENRVPLSPAHQSARRTFFFGAFAAYALVGASYARSDLVMNYSERFAYHFWGFSSVFVMLAVGGIFAHFRTLVVPRAIRSGLWVLAGVALYLPFARALEQWPHECMYRYNYALGTQMHYVPVAHWLEENMPPNATLAVYPDAGIVPYVTRLRTIDFGKLNDLFLAREAKNSSDIIDYFFKRKPDAVMMYLGGGFDKAYDETGRRLLADPRFAAYQLTLLSLDQGIGTALFVKQ